MANIITNEGELFRKTMSDTQRSFHRVQAGKGSRWRTLPNETYKKNFESIDWGHSEKSESEDDEEEKNEHSEEGTK